MSVSTESIFRSPCAVPDFLQTDFSNSQKDVPQRNTAVIAIPHQVTIGSGEGFC